MRKGILIAAVLLAAGCSNELAPPVPDAAGPPVVTDKVRIPAHPGQATLEFWDAVDAYLADGAEFLPADPAVDTNAAGRTLSQYLPRDHPWFAGTSRFTYTGSRWSYSATIREEISESKYLDLLFVSAYPSLGPPPDHPRWDTWYGSTERTRNRFKRTVRDAVAIQRGFLRFMAAGTPQPWYPMDVYRALNDAGRPVMSYVRGPDPLPNRYTGVRNNPGTGPAPAVGPGAIRVGEVFSSPTGWNTGFVVSAEGVFGGWEALTIVYDDPVPGGGEPSPRSDGPVVGR
ncbi:hypothetical protein KDM41_08465 [bacterium]|nr:hypothetical protein [bacterium]